MMDCSTRYSKSPRFDTIHQTFLTAELALLSCVISRFFLSFWLSLLLALSPIAASAADGIEFTQASLEATDEGFRLSTSFSFELTQLTRKEDCIGRLGVNEVVIIVRDGEQNAEMFLQRLLTSTALSVNHSLQIQMGIVYSNRDEDALKLLERLDHAELQRSYTS